MVYNIMYMFYIWFNIFQFPGGSPHLKYRGTATLQEYQMKLCHNLPWGKIEDNNTLVFIDDVKSNKHQIKSPAVCSAA